MNYMQIQRVSYSIVQEKTLFLGFVQKYYCPQLLHYCYLVQGLFQGMCRNITVPIIALLLSCAGPLLGYVQKYQFWGEIFTSVSQFSFTNCSRHNCCCSTHAPSPWQELSPLSILQQTLLIPVIFISDFNAVINSGKSYLGSPQNFLQRTHTADTKSQPWKAAFQQEPSW